MSAPPVSPASRLHCRLAKLLAVGALLCLPALGARAFDDSIVPSARAGAAPSFTAAPILELDLPLSFRFRMDGAYLKSRYSSETLALGRVASVGPALRRSPMIESRMTLTHPFWQGLELGLAWMGRGEPSELQGLELAPQVVGAFVRFVH
ncbi:MAG: hypothetical protein JRG86_03540 [Deltaproteobacteria bacterium]|jgi:hypothetical protein|nr:hypothetical protein [Deltaproteobacteria bacterium]MBW2497876.1 hypothetical protein [Deltaproteobacteria bacterium]